MCCLVHSDQNEARFFFPDKFKPVAVPSRDRRCNCMMIQASESREASLSPCAATAHCQSARARDRASRAGRRSIFPSRQPQRKQPALESNGPTFSFSLSRERIGKRKNMERKAASAFVVVDRQSCSGRLAGNAHCLGPPHYPTTTTLLLVLEYIPGPMVDWSIAPRPVHIELETTGLPSPSLQLCIASAVCSQFCLGCANLHCKCTV